MGFPPQKGKAPEKREKLTMWEIAGRSWSRAITIMCRLMLSQPTALDFIDRIIFLISPGSTGVNAKGVILDRVRPARYSGVLLLVRLSRVGTVEK